MHVAINNTHYFTLGTHPWFCHFCQLTDLDDRLTCSIIKYIFQWLKVMKRNKLLYVEHISLFGVTSEGRLRWWKRNAWRCFGWVFWEVLHQAESVWVSLLWTRGQSLKCRWNSSVNRNKKNHCVNTGGANLYEDKCSIFKVLFLHCTWAKPLVCRGVVSPVQLLSLAACLRQILD